MDIQLALFHQELQRLDPSLRADYEDAMARCPALVQEESNPAEFLQWENGRAFDAALGVARYWKIRKLVFPQRWWRPLKNDLTGSGALSEDDVALLGTGYFLTLPRRNRNGVFVLVDRSRLSRLKQNMTPTAPLRIFFYYCTLYRSNFARGATITVLHVVTPAFRAINLPNTQPEEARKNSNAFMISAALFGGKISPKIFVAAEPGQSKEWSHIQVQSLARALHKRSNVQPECIVGSMEETLEQLQERGIERELVPRSLGGTFDYRQFDQWIDQARFGKHVGGMMPLVGVLPRSVAQTQFVVQPPRLRQDQQQPQWNQFRMSASTVPDGIPFSSSFAPESGRQALVARRGISTLSANLRMGAPAFPGSTATATTTTRTPPDHRFQSYTGFLPSSSHLAVAPVNALIPSASSSTNPLTPLRTMEFLQSSLSSSLPIQSLQVGGTTTASEPTDERTPTVPMQRKRIRTYQKHNMEIDRLKQQKTVLESRRTELSAECRKLENWLAQARLLVAVERERANDTEGGDGHDKTVHIIP